MHNKIFDSRTKTWVAPAYAVGQSWPGCCTNDHFATLEDAQVYFARQRAFVMRQRNKKGQALWVEVEKAAPYPGAWVIRVEFNHFNTGKRHGTLQIFALPTDGG